MQNYSLLGCWEVMFLTDRWSTALLHFIEPPILYSLAGVSRSVTLVVAYIMTITDFGWEDALSVVRAARSCANPNMGFQRQLQDFEKHDVNQVNELQTSELRNTTPSQIMGCCLLFCCLSGLSDSLVLLWESVFLAKPAPPGRCG